MLARIRTACLTLGATLSIALATSTPTPTLAQTAGTLQQSIASCDRGDQAACLAAGLALSDVENRAYDPFLALRFLQQACAANQTAACGRLALIFFAGEGDVERDLPSAGNFAIRACAGNDRDGCEVAEAVFAEPGSAQFDAEKALRYRRANCTFGNRRSCIDLARILYAMDDALPAEQIALAACVPGDPASAQVCAFGQRLQSLRRKAEAAREAAIQAARNAQAREQAVFDQYMGRRDYDGALYYSLYHLRSKSHAETAIMAAARVRSRPFSGTISTSSNTGSPRARWRRSPPRRSRRSGRPMIAASGTAPIRPVPAKRGGARRAAGERAAPIREAAPPTPRLRCPAAPRSPSRPATNTVRTIAPAPGGSPAAIRPASRSGSY